MMSKILLASVFILLFTAIPHHALAILPPDIIFSIGSQFFQIFSVIALAVSGVIGSVLLALRPRFAFLREHVYLTFGLLTLILVLVIGGFWVAQLYENSKAHTPSTSNPGTLTPVTTTHHPSAGAVVIDGRGDEGVGDDVRGVFKNDTIFLYKEDESHPFYIELQLSRKQNQDGTYVHYYYLSGVYDGVSFDDYFTANATNTIPVSGNSFASFVRSSFSDQSARANYHIELLVDGKIMGVDIENTGEEFFTKDTLTYTRYESASLALVSYDGRAFSADALVEGIYSRDYAKSIFFEGYDDVKQDTHQFVLWDSAGNFYMMDRSDVSSNSPAYPSHNWLLHKNTKGYAKKAFDSDLSIRTEESGEESGFAISIPDFNEAQLDLAVNGYVDGVSEGSHLRAFVAGKIRDADGERNISGFVQIVK